MSLGAIIECYLPFVLEDLGLIRIIILVKSRQNLPMCGLVLCFSVNQVSNLSEAEKENVVIKAMITNTWSVGTFIASWLCDGNTSRNVLFRISHGGSSSVKDSW